MSGDFNATGVRWAGQGYGMVEFGRDDQMMVIFYTRAVENEAKSREMGRKICEDRNFVKIFTPGERLNQVDRPVQDTDKQRWPRQWADFVHKRTQVPDGTPIDLLFPNHPAIAENLKAMGIYTIEQQANLSANGIDSIGLGGQEYVNKAKAYIKSSEKGLGFNKLQAELATRDQQIKILQGQVMAQKRQIDDMMQKMLNPALHSNSPPWVPGYDAQTERINATQVTNEIASQAKKRAVKRPVQIEDENQLNLIDEMEK